MLENTRKYYKMIENTKKIKNQDIIRNIKTNEKIQCENTRYNNKI